MKNLVQIEMNDDGSIYLQKDLDDDPMGMSTAVMIESDVSDKDLGKAVKEILETH